MALTGGNAMLVWEAPEGPAVALPAAGACTRGVPNRPPVDGKTPEGVAGVPKYDVESG